MSQQQTSNWHQNNLGVNVNRNVASHTRRVIVESSEGYVPPLQAELTDTVADLRERALESLGRQTEYAQRYAVGLLNEQSPQQFQPLMENTTVEELAAEGQILCLQMFKVPSYGPKKECDHAGSAADNA